MYKSLLEELNKIKVKGCIIKQGDTIVAEYYKNNKAAKKQHKIHSCTKSVTSALVGICLEKGLIASLDVTIDHYFGDYLKDSEKGKISIYQLLTMTDGLDWPEFGIWNAFAPMHYQKDMTEFVLSRDLVHTNETHMNYNSGASHLLGEIVSRSSGMTVVEFAKKELFEPLAIQEFEWWERDGHALSADGLKMCMTDMMKFGELYLHDGVYNGKRILSEDWVKASFVPRYMTYADIGSYCYHWWHTKVSDGVEEMDVNFALGVRGQYIIVVPKLDMVIVITSDLEDTLKPLRVVKNMLTKCNRIL